MQIYESIMGTPAGAPTTGLLQATQYLKDNRLLPRGFDKRTAAAEIGVFGAAAADEDFTGDGDRVRYRIPARSRRRRHGRGRAAVSADRLSLGAEPGPLRRAGAAAIRRLLQHVGVVIIGAGRACVTAYRTVKAEGMTHRTPATALATLRRLLLGILLFGLVGTAAELMLIGHDEDAWQMIPLVVLGVAMLAGVVALVQGFASARRRTRLFRAAMVLLMLSGATGRCCTTAPTGSSSSRWTRR